MDAKYLAEIKARDNAELPETAAPVFRDRHALLAEVERLNAENANIRTQLDRFVETDFKIGAENATLKRTLEMANITIQKLSGENYEYSTSSFQAQEQEAEKK